MQANKEHNSPVQGWRTLASQFWRVLYHSLLGKRSAPPPCYPEVVLPPQEAKYEPLQRIILTDGVGRTLFEEYAAHRRTSQGHEEIGWVLLGLRERDHAVALATLPAGTHRDAGVAHVLFNSTAQAVACSILRQTERRLLTLGVVHTHPGSLRHPSEGDYRGDIVWVRELRNAEGIFAIGTADGKRAEETRTGSTLFAQHPQPHLQRLGELTFAWYTLREGQSKYQNLPVELTLGPDLARPLHSIWSTLEAHAGRLERLYYQQKGVRCKVMEEETGPTLTMTIPLAKPGEAILVLLGQGPDQPEEVRFLVLRGDEVFAVDCKAKGVDQGVYLLMAELADQR